MNSLDPDQALAVFAPDCVHVEPVGSPARHGHEELRTFFEATSVGGLRISLAAPPTVVGTHACFLLCVTLSDDPQDEAAYRFASTDVITVNGEGLIEEFTAYPDFDAALPRETA